MTDNEILNYFYEEWTKNGNIVFDLYCDNAKVVSQRKTMNQDVKLFNVTLSDKKTGELTVDLGDVIVKDAVPLTITPYEMEAYCDENEVLFEDYVDQLQFVVDNWNGFTKLTCTNIFQKRFYEIEDYTLTEGFFEYIDCLKENNNEGLFIDKFLKSIK